MTSRTEIEVVENLATVQIGAAVAGADPHADVPLKPGDILAIHQITNWNDIGESVTIDGQVRYSRQLWISGWRAPQFRSAQSRRPSAHRLPDGRGARSGAG